MKGDWHRCQVLFLKATTSQRPRLGGRASDEKESSCMKKMYQFFSDIEIRSAARPSLSVNGTVEHSIFLSDLSPPPQMIYIRN
mmetsp:Transcript_5870/g.36409  ORF Transcript_5870/g.36409 Transcript_5870/m.36409 type:complete len:83 (+) Transcript_5870:732-980(+)